MNYRAARGLQIRLVIILALIGISAGGIFARAVQLQFLKAPHLQKLLARQHKNTIVLRGERGAILDARGEALAVSSARKSQVFAHPEQVDDPARTAALLADILGLNPREVLAKLYAREAAFVWITRNGEESKVKKVEALELAGIGVLPLIQRRYPGGSLAANVIGFTGVEGTGLEGLEYHYERVLAGSAIRIWQERDGRGKPLFLSVRGESQAESKLSPPLTSGSWSPGGEASDLSELLFNSETRGRSIKLTLLRPLQYVVERELEKGIKNAKANSGCVIVMEPDTGRVLAMASYPDFDPNRFREHDPASFRNRCLINAYEPGSTFKVFVAASALDQGALRADEKIFCEHGTYSLGGETINDPRPRGWLSVSEVVAYSSNIGAAKIGERMGREGLFEAVRGFGFGQRTGIDFPGESAGILRPYKQWSTVGVGTISFGQGIAVTPLQMVTALSAIANQGALMRPYLVESILLPDGREQIQNRPQKKGQALSAEASLITTEFMKQAVKIGTGQKAAVPGYTVAGKTGTAQKAEEGVRGYAKGKYVASFMGFLPASRPRLAIIVVIDEPDPEKPYGGEVAAPVFREIARQAMILLRVPSEAAQDKIARQDPGRARADEGAARSRIRKWKEEREWRLDSAERAFEQGEKMPDLSGLTLRQALRLLKSSGLPVEITGTGLVAAQYPAPGAALDRDILIRMVLEASP